MRPITSTMLLAWKDSSKGHCVDSSVTLTSNYLLTYTSWQSPSLQDIPRHCVNYTFLHNFLAL